MKLFNSNVVKYFLIITIPIVIILGNFRYLVFNSGFYQELYQQSNVYQTFDKNQTLAITNNLLNYFRGKNMLDHNFFSNQAILHLKDVKDLVLLASSLLYLTTAVIFIFIAILVAKRKYQTVAQAFFISAVMTIIFVLLLSLGTFKAFEPLFVSFHQTLFTNTLWLFPEGDNLIKLFPQDFFIGFASRLASNIGLTCLVIAATSFVLKRKFAK